MHCLHRTGVDSLEIPKVAAQCGLRIYTVVIGAVVGETIGFEGWPMRVRLDEETLTAITTKTQVNFFTPARRLI